MPTQLLYNVHPAATQALGGISRSKIYSEIKAGRIRTVHLGSRAFIAHTELERYVASLRE